MAHELQHSRPVRCCNVVVSARSSAASGFPSVVAGALVVYAFAVCSHYSALVLKIIEERDACHELASVTCLRNGGMIRRLALRLGTIASFELG